MRDTASQLRQIVDQNGAIRNTASLVCCADNEDAGEQCCAGIPSCLDNLPLDALRSIRIPKKEVGGMTMKVRTALVGVLCALLLMALPALAERGPGKGELFWGDGIKLVSGPGSRELTIHKSEQVWIRGGFVTPFFPQAAKAMRDQFDDKEVAGFGLGGLYFGVIIDGLPVHLDHQVLWFPPGSGPLPPGFPPDASSRVTMWYKQFPAGYFAIGDHVIVTDWGSRNPNNPEIYYSDLPCSGTTILHVLPDE